MAGRAAGEKSAVNRVTRAGTRAPPLRAQVAIIFIESARQSIGDRLPDDVLSIRIRVPPGLSGSALSPF